MRKMMRLLLCSYVLLAAAFALADDVAVIGHKGLPPLDARTIQKLFTGRVIEIAGVPVTVVNAAPGSSVRSHFLEAYLEQDEEAYIAYWTVRQFIGKGRPPKELSSSADIIGFVQSRPGAIGYIDVRDVTPGLNVLGRK
jgi:ABC-type phosphate transport system substrate-binding protein